ncbi:kinetochore-associated protein NSL1 homolog isoform X2 [Phyllostomus discolor]|uniref:Kinetochore-associated protein NSL1 homolog isoform X2 n=1 Tax=Phyllostomus discolor TaxID=89673 RepID=A0A7E6CV56_9CHIR|nr:kinetochore-associated protein NSL1 homolog isoform X2 [Phyllostomus discolor]
MAGTPELEVLSPLGAVERVAGAEDRTSVPATTRQDFRVRCTSKRAVMELVELCGPFLQQLGDSLPDQIREPALRDAQLLSQLYKRMSALTGKHGRTLQMIVSEKQYHPVVHPLDLKSDPDPASRVDSLKCRGEAMAEEISRAMKSLPALIEQGNGFSQVLKMQPIIQLQRIHQEVFSSCDGKPDVKSESFITQIETTPTETTTRKTSNLVLKRKQTKDCPQRKWYPLRPKRIHLDT